MSLQEILLAEKSQQHETRQHNASLVDQGSIGSNSSTSRVWRTP